jgi:hypothetical protein
MFIKKLIGQYRPPFFLGQGGGFETLNPPGYAINLIIIVNHCIDHFEKTMN